MESGYLILETRPDHPDWVRIRTSLEEPRPSEGEAGAQIRYIAYFNDLRAAKMHAHEALHKRLIDIDHGTYRVGLEEAIATVEAEILRHKRVWIDPELDEAALARIADKEQRLERRHELTDYLWHIVAAIAVLLLVLLQFFAL